MKTFKKFDGTEIPDAGQYVLDYMNEHPDAKVTIGTDSKQRKRHTLYVTVIALQRESRGGVHIIYTKDTISRQNDLFSRLWGEVERSKNVADELAKLILREYCDKGFKFMIHLDLNADPKHKSHSCYQAGMGYIQSLDYLVEAKPAGWAASRAADMLVNAMGPRRRRKASQFA